MTVLSTEKEDDKEDAKLCVRRVQAQFGTNNDGIMMYVTLVQRKIG